MVVLDKITDPKLRSKAGYPDKVDLGGHYDTIEDFFEDLRNVDVPKRIIDTQTKMLKKSRATIKDLGDMKGVWRLDADKNGIMVHGAGVHTEIKFVNGESAEQTRRRMAEYYDQFAHSEEVYSDIRSDASAIYGELKDLVCKLADMTEDEMRRYLTSKNGNSYDDGGVRFRIEGDEDSSQNLYLSLQNKKGKEYYDTVTEIANRVARGEARFTSLPEEYESRGVLSIQQATARAIASAWLREREGGSASVGDRTSYDVPNDVQLGKSRNGNTCEDQIETWAKQNGCWINEENYSSKDYVQNRSGQESVVYFVGDKVVKFTSYKTLHSKNGIGEFLNRITLVNAIDPESALKVIGFSRDKDGTFKIVLEQKKFVKAFDLQIDEDGNFTEEGEKLLGEWYKSDAPKIKRQFARKGIKYNIGDLEATYKDNVKILDLGAANIACDEKGKYHIIDANATLIRQDKEDYNKPTLVDNTENGSAEGETRFRKKDGEDTKNGDLTPREREQQERDANHRTTIEKESKNLNTDITIHDSVDDIDTSTQAGREAKAAIERGEKVKAWYDMKTGEVHLYMPNVTDKYDAQKSVAHEVVGHKGMRGLLGEEGYKSMMRRMYTHLSSEEAKEVNERMMRNGWDFYTAMDEWVTDQAEKLAHKIKSKM